MKKNYAADLYGSYQVNYLSTKDNKSNVTASKGKGLFERPSNKATMVTSNEPKDLMQEYFNSVRKKREEFNDTI